MHEPITRHMSRDFTTLEADFSVGEALGCLRRQNLGGKIVYFYVLDKAGKLVGVVPTRRLLMSELSTRVAEIMVPDVVTIPDCASVLEAGELFVDHRFLALPVVDEDGHVLGIVDVTLFTDEVANLAQQQSAERAFQLIGVHVAIGRTAPLWGRFKDRFPWLLCNIGGGLICAFLAGWFEHVLDAVILLALFVPVVLALGESVSIQSMTLTLQSLHGRRIAWRRLLRSLRRELATALLLGIASGTLIGGVAWIWRGEGLAALAIMVSITLAMMTACMLGVLVPTVVHAMRFDPKFAAGPAVLAMTDIATLLFYFGLASYLLV